MYGSIYINFKPRQNESIVLEAMMVIIFGKKKDKKDLAEA